MSTITSPAFTTLTAARAAGFHVQRREEYGGQEITVKGTVLVRNCEIARSRAEWQRQGFRVRQDATPHASIHVYRLGHHDVFRRDQVIPEKAQRVRQPVCHAANCESVLAAAFVANQSAKRYRDGAKKAYGKDAHSAARRCRSQKENLYELKDRAIAEGYRRGWLSAEAIHGGLVVYRGSGYCFHSRLLPEGLNLQAERGDGPIFREARPRDARQMRVCDAIATLEQLPEPDGFQMLAPPVMMSLDREGRNEETRPEISQDDYQDAYDSVFGHQSE